MQLKPYSFDCNLHWQWFTSPAAARPSHFQNAKEAQSHREGPSGCTTPTPPKRVQIKHAPIGKVSTEDYSHIIQRATESPQITDLQISQCNKNKNHALAM